MQSPTAVPRIPASASGVSTQRSGPKRSRSPAVARKTPPARPTSSPITITSSSRSSSTWKQSLIASTSGRAQPSPSTLLSSRGRQPERGGRIDERVLEEERRGRRAARPRPAAIPSRMRARRLGADRLGHLVRQDPRAPQVRLVAADALARALLLDALQVDVTPSDRRRSRAARRGRRRPR